MKLRSDSFAGEYSGTNILMPLARPPPNWAAKTRVYAFGLQVKLDVEWSGFQRMGEREQRGERSRNNLYKEINVRTWDRIEIGDTRYKR